MPVPTLRSGIAFLAGLVAADGHLEKKDPYIVISNKEFDFLNNFIAPLINDQINRTPRPYWDKSAKVWKIRVYSRKFWMDLIQNYGIPTGSKATRILPPKQLEPFERIWYIRGWFEGEGWIETMTVRRSSKIYQYPRIGFKVKNRPIRDWLLAELVLLGIRAKAYDRRDGTFGLWINGTKPCQAFLESIGFFYPPRNNQLQELIRKNRGLISPELTRKLRENQSKSFQI